MFQRLRPRRARRASPPPARCLHHDVSRPSARRVAVTPTESRRAASGHRRKFQSKVPVESSAIPLPPLSTLKSFGRRMQGGPFLTPPSPIFYTNWGREKAPPLQPPYPPKAALIYSSCGDLSGCVTGFNGSVGALGATFRSCLGGAKAWGGLCATFGRVWGGCRGGPFLLLSPIFYTSWGTEKDPPLHSCNPMRFRVNLGSCLGPLPNYVIEILWAASTGHYSTAWSRFIRLRASLSPAKVAKTALFPTALSL